jgi:hypothetical protein
LSDDIEHHVTITELQHPVEHVEATHKPIVIVLEWFVHDYKVKSITNTTWYKPGQWLAPNVVQKLCDLPGWQVNMVDNDLIAAITGMALNAGSKAITL